MVFPLIVVRHVTIIINEFSVLELSDGWLTNWLHLSRNYGSVVCNSATDVMLVTNAELTVCMSVVEELTSKDIDVQVRLPFW